MVEITFADSSKNFDCSKCSPNVMELRRCKEDRMDFTYKDSLSVFPIYAIKGGTPFGFCPGKATWFHHIHGLFRALVLCAETGQSLYKGSVMDRPDWSVQLEAWFIPLYKQYQFASRAKMVLGDGSKPMVSKPARKRR